MIKSFILIYCMLIGVESFAQNDVDYHHKRLINSLKKNGISDISQLKEINDGSVNSDDFQGKYYVGAKEGESDNIKYVYVGRVNSCRAGGCCNTANFSGNGESEYFDYFIFFDSQKTVQLVEVYNYQATHGYEITAKGWLKQFVGFSAKDTLVVNKEIDGISGATVSVFAITEDVQLRTRVLKSIQY